jgi:hypothetical protein
MDSLHHPDKPEIEPANSGTTQIFVNEIATVFDNLS